MTNHISEREREARRVYDAATNSLLQAFENYGNRRLSGGELDEATAKHEQALKNLLGAREAAVREEVGEYLERVQQAAARYEERPIDASDWPDSWVRLFELLAAVKEGS